MYLAWFGLVNVLNLSVPRVRRWPMMAIASLSLLTGVSGGLQQQAIAQVTADGTLSTIVTSSDNLNFSIDGGDRPNRGPNLFHSFDGFSVPTGGSAQFNNPTDVTNIIGRVTGAQASNIDGLISAQGSANVFLINPQGIAFGPNARLNIGGSFLASTAEQVLFEDGQLFRTTDRASTPLLTMSAPVGLQMGAEARGIVHQSRGFGVGGSASIGLLGGTVTVDGGNLNASNGSIELGGVGPNERVTLTQASNGYALRYDDVQQFEDVTLTNQAFISALGAPSGTIHVRGDRLRVDQGSILQSINAGTVTAGPIEINANRLIVDTEGLILSIAGGMGKGAAINITASEVLRIRGAGYESFLNALVNFVNNGSFDAEDIGAAVVSFTSSEAPAGNINVNTEALVIQNGGVLLSSTLPESAGATGKVTINATERVNVDESALFSVPGAMSARPGGNLIINTSHLRVADGAAVGTSSLGSDSAGNIRIHASTIDLIDTRAELPPQERIAATNINALTFGSGDAGNVRINTDSLRISGGAGIFTLSANASNPEAGDGGNIKITATDHVEVVGDIPFSSDQVLFSSLDTATASAAPAGNLVIQTGTLRVDGGQISSDTFGAGDGGDILITATEKVELIGSDAFTPADALEEDRVTRIAGTIFTSSLSTEPSIIPGQPPFENPGGGSSGDLTIITPRLEVRNFGGVTVESQTSGAAGTLEVTADSVVLDQSGRLLASTSESDGGDIRLTLSDTLILNDRSILSARSGQFGNGGSIEIQSPIVVAAQNSDIVANAMGGDGGRIQFTSQGVFGLVVRETATPGNDIIVSSELGISGVVEIDSPEVDPNSQLLELPELFVDIGDLIRSGCSISDDRFVLTGRGGLPNEPRNLVNEPRPWIDVRDPSTVSDSSPVEPIPAPMLPQTNTIQEATQMAIAPDGEVMLVSAAAERQNAPFSHPDCTSAEAIL